MNTSMTNFHQHIRQASTEIQKAWADCHCQPRVLFDALAAEWEWTPIGHKIHTLELLNRAGLLDSLMRVYLTQYSGAEDHVLGGLGFAVLEYEDEGYTLRLPPPNKLAPSLHPLHVAGLARLIEDHHLDCAQYDWLVHELRRLKIGIERWLRCMKARNNVDCKWRHKFKICAAI